MHHRFVYSDGRGWRPIVAPKLFIKHEERGQISHELPFIGTWPFDFVRLAPRDSYISRAHSTCGRIDSFSSDRGLA